MFHPIAIYAVAGLWFVLGAIGDREPYSTIATCAGLYFLGVGMIVSAVKANKSKGDD